MLDKAPAFERSMELADLKNQSANVYMIQRYASIWG